LIDKLSWEVDDEKQRISSCNLDGALDQFHLHG
jgi:hypothetical protein